MKIFASGGKREKGSEKSRKKTGGGTFTPTNDLPVPGGP